MFGLFGNSKRTAEAAENLANMTANLEDILAKTEEVQLHTHAAMQELDDATHRLEDVRAQIDNVLADTEKDTQRLEEVRAQKADVRAQIDNVLADTEKDTQRLEEVRAQNADVKQHLIDAYRAKEDLTRDVANVRKRAYDVATAFAPQDNIGAPKAAPSTVVEASAATSDIDSDDVPLSKRRENKAKKAKVGEKKKGKTYAKPKGHIGGGVHVSVFPDKNDASKLMIDVRKWKTDANGALVCPMNQRYGGFGVTMDVDEFKEVMASASTISEALRTGQALMVTKPSGVMVHVSDDASLKMFKNKGMAKLDRGQWDELMKIATNIV